MDSIRKEELVPDVRQYSAPHAAPAPLSAALPPLSPPPHPPHRYTLSDSLRNRVPDYV
jgi:hypothetical protein